MSLLTSTGRRFHIGWNRHLTSVSRLLFDMTDVKSLKNHHNYTQVIIQTKLLESLGMTTLLAFHDHYYQWTNFKNNQDTTSRITLMKWLRPDFLYVPDVLQKLQVQWPRPEDALIGWQENEEASKPENIEESVKVDWGQGQPPNGNFHHLTLCIILTVNYWCCFFTANQVKNASTFSVGLWSRKSWNKQSL
jgi:hypothetical protein